MVLSAIGLFGAAFVLPPMTEPTPVRKVTTVTTAEGVAVQQEAEPKGQRLLSSDVATTKIGRSNTSGRKKELAPISEVLPFAPSTVGDVTIALSVLAGYIQNGSAEQKQEARFRVGEFRREHFHVALCDLIRNNESPALSVIAELAIQQKPEGGIDALIERLNSTKRRIYARDTLIGTLCHFADDAKAGAQIELLLNSKNDQDRDTTWSKLGAEMPASFVKIALERVILGTSDAQAAAQALGRYGSTMQPAMKIVAEVEPHLVSGAQPVRARLVEMLAGLNSNATAARLRMMTSDINEDVRATTLKALARNPENTEVVLIALRNDASNRVKAACIDGLGSASSPEALSEMITLLSDEVLRYNAKRALVLANNGTDLGWQDLEWRAWLEKSIALQRANSNR